MGFNRRKRNARPSANRKKLRELSSIFLLSRPLFTGISSLALARTDRAVSRASRFPSASNATLTPAFEGGTVRPPRHRQAIQSRSDPAHIRCLTTHSTRYSGRISAVKVTLALTGKPHQRPVVSQFEFFSPGPMARLWAYYGRWKGSPRCPIT